MRGQLLSYFAAVDVIFITLSQCQSDRPRLHMVSLLHLCFVLYFFYIFSMVTSFLLSADQQALVYKNGILVDVKGPGKHTIWYAPLFGPTYEIVKMDLTDAPVALKGIEYLYAQQKSLLEEHFVIVEVTAGHM